jgi:hypothetical protein
VSIRDLCCSGQGVAHVMKLCGRDLKGLLATVGESEFLRWIVYYLEQQDVMVRIQCVFSWYTLEVLSISCGAMIGAACRHVAQSRHFS